MRLPGGGLGMEPGDGIFVGFDGGMADADSFIQIVWRESQEYLVTRLGYI
jgi:hypothetical protein